MRDLHLGTSAALWQDLIQESAQRQSLRLDETEESYLGFVLLRHARDAHLGARILALEWLQAQDEVGTRRADALRDVGDRCLLIAGLYPQLAARRRVTPDYFVALGRDAYAGVAHCARHGYADVFARLAAVYRNLVLVLRGLRPGALPQT